ncbi:MAG: polysaccharide biosynthesis/export family protein [Planctomycetota bacterium]
MSKPSDTTTQKALKIDAGVTSSDTTTQKLTKDNTGAELSDSSKEKEVVISEFILGTGDEIEITVYRHDDLNRKIRVPPEGKNTLPLIGEIQTKGVSIHQLSEKIKEGYDVYIENPQVTVEIASYKGQKIFVLGEVNNPGVYQFDPPTTVLEAVSKAGGFTLDGKDNSVVLIRGGASNPEIKKLDLESALDKGEVSQNMCLQTGDVVFVPRTFIANVDRFFSHFEKIIRPILFMEQAIIVAPRVEDVFQGESAGASKSKVPIVISPP